MKRTVIDLVRDGIPADVMRSKHGSRRLFGALVSSAMSYQQRGYTEALWIALLDQPTSALGRQNRTRRNGTAETPKRTRDRLARAWAAAAANVAEAPGWTRDDAQTVAREAAQGARDLAADLDAELTPNERQVLDVVAKIADERGSDRLTMPTGNRDPKTGERNGLHLWTGLGLTALRTALRGLDEKRLLVVIEPGAPRAKGRPARANVYRLATRPNPKNGVAMPPALSSDAPSQASSMPLALVSDAPSNHQENPGMDSITLTREQIVAALGEAALAALEAAQTERPHRETPCQITREHGPHDYGPMAGSGRLAHHCPGNVRHLRPVAGEARS